MTTQTEQKDGGAAHADEIRGQRNESTGRFEVSAWPKPRWSNPHFLTDELGHFEAALAARKTEGA